MRDQEVLAYDLLEDRCTTDVTNNNSSFQNYPHLDDHTIRNTDTPGFKPFIYYDDDKLINNYSPKWR